jgi:hypothetical protein
MQFVTPSFFERIAVSTQNSNCQTSSARMSETESGINFLFECLDIAFRKPSEAEKEIRFSD